MRLIALEIPDDPAEVAGWLERQVVGPDLAGLVAELEAVHGHDGDDATDQPDLDAAVAVGLGSLPRAALSELLRRPRLLMDLQERVLLEGGERWGQLARDGDASAVDRGRKRLLAAVGNTGGVVDEAEGRPDVLPMPRRPLGARRLWPLAVAMAASVLVATLAVDRFRPRAAGPGWGWAKPGALDADLPRDAYLAGLADSAEGWFRQTPEDPRSLARRLGEFRQGCSALILADHRPLPAEDRDWLVGKCRAWASKLDGILAEVEAGKDLAATREEADQTVRKLIVAIRDRAARPA